MKEREMIKVVIDGGATSDALLEFIRTQLDIKKSYLIELVDADAYPSFISNEKITIFPTIYVNFSTLKIEGYTNCINYLAETYM